MTCSRSDSRSLRLIPRFARRLVAEPVKLKLEIMSLLRLALLSPLERFWGDQGAQGSWMVMKNDLYVPSKVRKSTIHLWAKTMVKTKNHSLSKSGCHSHMPRRRGGSLHPPLMAERNHTGTSKHWSLTCPWRSPNLWHIGFVHHHPSQSHRAAQRSSAPAPARGGKWGFPRTLLNHGEKPAKKYIKMVYHHVVIFPLKWQWIAINLLPSIRDRDMIKNLLDKSTPTSFLKRLKKRKNAQSRMLHELRFPAHSIWQSSMKSGLVLVRNPELIIQLRLLKLLKWD